MLAQTTQNDQTPGQSAQSLVLKKKKSRKVKKYIVMKFFTNDFKDGIYQNLIDKELISIVSEKYPIFRPENLEFSLDLDIKKSVLELLDDDFFVGKILEIFDITVVELISSLYRHIEQYTSIFHNHFFIKKIKIIIFNKMYETNF